MDSTVDDANTIGCPRRPRRLRGNPTAPSRVNLPSVSFPLLVIWLGNIYVLKGLGNAAEEVKESTACVQMAESMREENVGFAAAVDDTAWASVCSA